MRLLSAAPVTGTKPRNSTIPMATGWPGELLLGLAAFQSPLALGFCLIQCPWLFPSCHLCYIGFYCPFWKFFVNPYLLPPTFSPSSLSNLPNYCPSWFFLPYHPCFAHSFFFFCPWNILCASTSPMQPHTPSLSWFTSTVDNPLTPCCEGLD